jgi:[ribosomal protein S5]-alanine N-acetyltransferase
MISAPPRADIPAPSELEPVLRTERLVLRPFVEDDVESLWPYVSDPELARHMSWAAHTQRHETLDFVRSRIEAAAAGTDLTLAVVHDDRAQGCIGLHGMAWEMRAWRVDRAELGYWLAPPLWGRGLITEAARAVVDFGFATLGLHKITVGCLDGNQGSQRVIEKLGFRFVGRLVDDAWRDGAWWSHLRYELLAAEWAARRTHA